MFAEKKFCKTSLMKVIAKQVHFELRTMWTVDQFVYPFGKGQSQKKKAEKKKPVDSRLVCVPFWQRAKPKKKSRKKKAEKARLSV